ncbi:hypothetical protein EO244_04825 [Ancylomarina salipaludis]|uniref:Uncharacterized protein n=1 Tax=Ancylomarina salipaludis TaxID=2501299 RepID=A0A4Q1JNC0_9BACT|nr:hypothetical protein [Ancylomarina salipaludis]RXQ96168.1 hypothetical protein EO244_04825 [Ancylomarina salipaludis]
MKHYALLISILSITFSCANQKNTPKKIVADSAQVTKEIPINKPDFAPNTLALNIKILKIIPHNEYNEIHATVNKTLGSGAGIIGIYSKGKEISFETKSNSDVKINSNYSFLFKESQTMGNNDPILNLIKEVK